MTSHAPPTWRRIETAVAAGVLMFAAGLVTAAWLGGGRQAWHTLLTVPPTILPGLLALSMVNYVARGTRWLLFSRALHLGVPPWRNALYYVAGFSMTTSPGKLGEAIRLWLLNRNHGCAYDRTAALMVADRLADGVSTIIAVSATVGWFADYVWITVGALAVACVLALLMLRPGLLLWGIDVAYAKLRRLPRLFVRARRAVRALQKLADPRLFAVTLLLGTVGWCAEGVSFYVVLHSLGVMLDPYRCVFIFSFGMLVGAASFMPGGLGSTEATMIGLLTTQHVPFDVAVVATAVVRVTTLWFAVSLGLCALPLALRRVPEPARG